MESAGARGVANRGDEVRTCNGAPQAAVVQEDGRGGPTGSWEPDGSGGPCMEEVYRGEGKR